MNQRDALFFTLFIVKATVCGPTDSRFKSKRNTIATLYTWHTDDGLKMSPKPVEAWKRNKVKRIVLVLVHDTITMATCTKAYKYSKLRQTCAFVELQYNVR
jgi:hypothetical protein